MDRIFYCYSERLKKALCANGFRYIRTGVNKRTNSKYYLFHGTDELNEYKNTQYQKERDKF